MEQKEKDVWSSVSVTKKAPMVDTIVTKQNQVPPVISPVKTHSEKKWKLFFGITLFICIVLLSVLAFFLFNQNTEQEGKSALENPQSEIELLLTELSQFIVLPQDQDVTLATVTNPAELQGQAFFRNAEVGDKVLIWATTRKAILYRPLIKKIIEVSSVEVLENEDNEKTPQ